MQMALQPMLVTALDGMNITMLEAGQYHNAAVADGKLYMWGYDIISNIAKNVFNQRVDFSWGIYGQLGNGSCENIATPKLVSFFKYKVRVNYVFLNTFLIIVNFLIFHRKFYKFR